MTLPERASSQSHFIDLCRLLDQPSPTAAGPTGEFYGFERGATKSAVLVRAPPRPPKRLMRPQRGRRGTYRRGRRAPMVSAHLRRVGRNAIRGGVLEQETIRARRIELEDDEGNLKLVLEGGKARGEENPGLIVYGPDGPASGVAISVNLESGVPYIAAYTVGDGRMLLTFFDGVAVVQMKNEDGTEGTLTPQ